MHGQTKRHKNEAQVETPRCLEPAKGPYQESRRDHAVRRVQAGADSGTHKSEQLNSDHEHLVRVEATSTEKTEKTYPVT